MFTFNNETIFTGYIKQLLADFNLPKYKVYTQADAKYHEEAVEHNKHLNSGDEAWPEESVNIIETITDKDADSQDIKYIRYINYIKGNNIERYINNKWVPTKWHYHYNKKELNQTKNLSIKNNIYDSYTHEYLGEYLRFQRDYNNINLMSMYNCFSNTICQHLHINHSNSQKIKFIFDTDNKKYRIYMLPVKLFKKYTIAIDSSEPVEMCCSFFSKYYLPEISYDSIAENNNTVFNLEELTYKKFTALQFNTPIIYDKLWISDNKKEGCLLKLSKEQRVICTQHEADLKLFIKLPLNNKSSITVLEGDYRHFNDTLLKVAGSSANIVSNKSVTNFDEADIDKTAEVLRKIIGEKKDNRKEDAKGASGRYVLERAVKVLKRKLKKEAECPRQYSIIESYIVTLVNNKDFKYNFETVMNIKYIEFTLSVKQILHNIHISNIAIGVYTGNVLSEKLSTKDQSCFVLEFDK